MNERSLRELLDATMNDGAFKSLVLRAFECADAAAYAGGIDQSGLLYDVFMYEQMDAYIKLAIIARYEKGH